jgi:uncharacterized protein YuzE
MIVEYDEEADAAFLWFSSGESGKQFTTEVWPTELRDQVGLLFDTSNKLVGLEILFASNWLPEQLIENAQRRASGK